MKKYSYFLAILGMLWIATAQSQSPLWRDISGTPILETESMKSKNDFAGSVLVTTDADWKEKWDTPPETKPNFNKAGTIPYGKKVFVLTFFSNPAKDDGGNSNIRCDLKIITPTGKILLSQQGMTCFSGRIAGSSYNLFLSKPVIAFSGDPGDPTGTWVVEVALRDVNRNVELPLRTTFELK